MMRNAGLGVAEKSVWAYQSLMPHVSIEERQAWENASKVSYICNRCADALHKTGKFYGVHMDGLLAVLKEGIAASHLDFIEVFTPPPMGDLSLEDARRAWPDKTLWVNFPGNVFCGSKPEVTQYTLGLLESGMARGASCQLSAKICQT